MYFGGAGANGVGTCAEAGVSGAGTTGGLDETLPPTTSVIETA